MVGQISLSVVRCFISRAELVTKKVVRLLFVTKALQDETRVVSGHRWPSYRAPLKHFHTAERIGEDSLMRPAFCRGLSFYTESYMSYMDKSVPKSLYNHCMETLPNLAKQCALFVWQKRCVCKNFRYIMSHACKCEGVDRLIGSLKQWRACPGHNTPRWATVQISTTHVDERGYNRYRT